MGGGDAEAVTAPEVQLHGLVECEWQCAIEWEKGCVPYLCPPPFYWTWALSSPLAIRASSAVSTFLTRSRAASSPLRHLQPSTE